MSGMSLPSLAEKMRAIDVAMLSTHTDGGAIAARPMSNNGEVDYDGESYYFTWETSRMVRDIERDARVSLGFQGDGGFMAAVAGEAELIRDRGRFAERWNPDLDRWFEDGVETDGLVMIAVRASRVNYWDGGDDGEVTL